MDTTDVAHLSSSNNNSNSSSSCINNRGGDEDKFTQVHSLTNQIESNLRVANSNSYYDDKNCTDNFNAISQLANSLTTRTIKSSSSDRNNRKIHTKANNQQHNQSKSVLKSKRPISPFNPFADENDSNSNFQLSKTSDFHKKSPTRYLESSPFARTFGYNRTNLMPHDASSTSSTGKQFVSTLRKCDSEFISTLSTSPNVSRFQIKHTGNRNQSNDSSESRQVFRPLLPDNHQHRIVVATAPPPLQSQAPSFVYQQQNADEQMTFKTYDLNDEYWLNFDH